jgi:hypothetical protein
VEVVTGRYYQGTKELPLPPELLLPTDGHGGGQVFQICSDGLGTEADGGLSWSSVEAGENEEGAAVVAFSCMARLTASLPSSALTERRCHRSLASMRRPYFSAFRYTHTTSATYSSSTVLRWYYHFS